jgi:glyoxylase-like metal-dependent hydrolase (beta-lactamase superfamily II)
MLREPVPGVLLLCDGGWLLLDTGYNTALITDRALRARFHGDPLVQPVLPGPGEPLAEALEAAGVDLADVHAIAVSHLHYDHAGGLKHFAGRVPVHIQRSELDYGMSAPPGPEANGIFRVDFDDPRIDWRAAEGDTEIAPGVTAVLTAGHTPGHQSFVVRMDPSAGGGGFVFAFDAADLTENIERADRGLGGAERGPDPQAQEDRQEARLPAGTRARPGCLACAHRGAGRPGPAQVTWAGPGMTPHPRHPRLGYAVSPPGRCRSRPAPGPSGGRVCHRE